MTNIAVIIRRFFEGPDSGVSTATGDSRTRGKDFMRHDLTAVTRF